MDVHDAAQSRAARPYDSGQRNEDVLWPVSVCGSCKYARGRLGSSSWKPLASASASCVAIVLDQCITSVNAVPLLTGNGLVCADGRQGKSASSGSSAAERI